MDGESSHSAGRAPRLFGTDGVRGLANVEPMTPETALKLGRALAAVCRRDEGGRATVILGTDTRRSAGMLEGALAAGVASMGVDVLLAGVVPTPAVAVLTRSLQCVAGAVVSASHNPARDNGVKFFGHDGFKLRDEAEAAIEQRVLDAGLAGDRPTATDLGMVRPLNAAAEHYSRVLRQAVPGDFDLRGIRVVVDCANGAAYRVGPEILRALGADVITLGVCPDGDNINLECGAMHPQALQQAVLAERAVLGVALDGDADRVLLVDERGGLVDGDEMLAMMGVAMLEQGRLRHGTVVATVMSNIGLELCLREHGGGLARTAVGDRYVVDEMVRHGYNLGGEQSGHMVFLDHGTTGDGLLATLQVLQLMTERNQPLAALKRVMTRFPQTLINVRVSQRRALDTVPRVQRTIDRITTELGDRGRVVVRYSGTEPLVRVMVEGESAERVQAHAERIAAVIGDELGADA